MPMAQNFTHKDPMQNSFKQDAGYTFKPIRTNPVNVSPSDTIIKNLLNYSKALTAIPNSMTGTFSLILLN